MEDFFTVGQIKGQWAVALIRSWTWPVIHKYFDTEEEAREYVKTHKPPVRIGY